MKCESMMLCPDSDAGYQALHEAVQDGWMPIFHWSEGATATPINHIVLRREVPVNCSNFIGATSKPYDSAPNEEQEQITNE